MQPKVSNKHDKMIQIKTSDMLFYNLPQWQIEASRLLHTKQEFLVFNEKCSGQKLYPPSLNTITKKQLGFFSQALRKNNFTRYYQERTPEERQLLINLAGENQLMSPILTILLALECFDTNIIQHIASFLSDEMNTVHNHLKRSLVIHNLTLNGYKQSVNGYQDDKYLSDLIGHNYDEFPFVEPILLKDEQHIPLKIKKKNKNESYYITRKYLIENDTVDSKDNNKVNIWVINSETKTKNLKKIVEHSSEIKNIQLSNNGKYLVTSSTDEPNNELIITYLKQQKKIPAFSHLILKENKDNISDICFNPPSTILAIGSENGIKLLDPKTLSTIKKLDMPRHGKCVELLEFNKANTLLAASILHQEPMKYIIQLYDISKPDSIIKITQVKKTIEQICGLTFSSDNELIITGTYQTIVIDRLGKTIIKTKMSPFTDQLFSVQIAVLMTDINMLVTAQVTNEKYCDTKIWDIQSKEILAVLLCNATKVNGVGISENGQSIITTHYDHRITQTDLYTANAATSLEWIKNGSNLLQRYLLLRLYRAKKIDCEVNLDKNPIESKVFNKLPTTPSNVKRLVQNHLFKKSISK